MAAEAPKIEVIENFQDWRWRIANLYWIIDKQARKVRFIPNDSQWALYEALAEHRRQGILKARQRGFTTAIDILALDHTLFLPNFSAGIIAHTEDDAKVIFQTKVKFPFECLPDGLKNAVNARTDRVDEYRFGHNSSIRVSTSYRSGTVNFLHVSEMGYIAAHRPDRAREIMTGALEAVPLDGGIAVIESTAEGREGRFFDLITTAKNNADEGRKPSDAEFGFFFEPWWSNPEYALPPDQVIIDRDWEVYWEELEGDGIKLTNAQKAWYVAKEATLGDDMKREYPATPEEAFEASIQGAYFRTEMARLRRLRRITEVAHEPHLPVNVFWDRGLNDETSLWFHQRLGKAHMLIDYYEQHSEGLGHYANVLGKKARDLGYIYGRHFMPHDAKARIDVVTSAEPYYRVAESLGIKPVKIVQRPKNGEEVNDQIECTRGFLTQCWIDRKNCAKGITHLDNYHKEWDERQGTFKNKPAHTPASNGADALRTGAVGWEEDREYTVYDVEPEPDPDY